KHPERYVGHQPQPDGFLQQRAESFDDGGVAEPIQCGIRTIQRQFPVTLGSDASVFEYQAMSRKELVDPFEHRLDPRGTARREHLGKHRAVWTWCDQSALENRLDLGCEEQPVINERPVQRLHPKAIACEKQPTLADIPDAEGEHSTESVHALVAPLLVRM